ncbi:hypothetical protein GCM10007857_40540 [Bradyrhizobium iriomotense]|uniref:Uncharacterized protein n=1 Tax=Bradyrhizobium iriomotense TaxID=441950 RepID=A0ABQ6AZJ3_9BRAD|nr:hypothetical protein GCM10007857_40540 [Bradyrhizobium iriomotense]
MIPTCPGPTVIEAFDWTVRVRLFSVPVPKPVVLAPSQLTVLPDCTQAAIAGLAGIATIAAADNKNGAANVGARPNRTLAANAGNFTVFISTAPFLDFIICPNSLPLKRLSPVNRRDDSVTDRHQNLTANVPLTLWSVALRANWPP